VFLYSCIRKADIWVLYGPFLGFFVLLFPTLFFYTAKV
jgi:hypothetical protein